METGQAVYAAIVQVTAALAREGIGKVRKNQQQGYSFRGIDDVYNALSRELANARLCIIPRVLRREVTERQNKTGGSLFYVVVEVEYDLVSAVDGSRHTAKAFGEAMDSGDKATNKAMSAAYKYLAFQLFCIPTEGDNDPDATTHEVVAQDTSRREPPSALFFNGKKPFNPDEARAAIARLPGATDRDKERAAKLAAREDLMDLYAEIKHRQERK